MTGFLVLGGIALAAWIAFKLFEEAMYNSRRDGDHRRQMELENIKHDNAVRLEVGKTTGIYKLANGNSVLSQTELQSVRQVQAQQREIARLREEVARLGNAEHGVSHTDGDALTRSEADSALGQHPFPDAQSILHPQPTLQPLQSQSEDLSGAFVQ